MSRPSSPCPHRPRAVVRALLPAALAIALSAGPFAAGDGLAAPRPGRASGRIAPPLPPPRPEPAGAPAAEEPSRPPEPAALRSPSDGDPAACLERLARVAVTLEPRPPIAAGACGARHPFRLSSLPNGVALSPAAELGCPIAEAFAGWVDDVLVPEAAAQLGRVPKRLLVGASYECRGRNRVAGAKLSEHAFANAVDIMGVEFETGPPIAVRAWPAGSPEARFLSEIKARACAHFTTVLGPGSDAAHADHLHFDLRERRRGFRMCQ